MTKELLEKLQVKTSKLLDQMANHQQSKAVIYELEEQINALKAQNDFVKKDSILNLLSLISAAIVDPLGLGRLNLMLENARVPKKYYDIFYEMLYTQNRGGGRTPRVSSCLC